MPKLLYSSVGDDYETKDPVKLDAQKLAKKTAAHLKHAGFSEIAESRGESAFVWDQGNCLMASVIEGLGTKNLIADGMRNDTGKSYYDHIAHDTVATVINDLISVGARPLVIHAYWAIETNEWLSDTTRLQDLITGWTEACDISRVTWGGGETPTLKDLLLPDTIELGGSAVGIIIQKERLITDKKLKDGDRILLLKSTGINANGASLARAVADTLPKRYRTKLLSGMTYGEALLAKSNIYSRLIVDLVEKDVDIHYLSNITGHGMRKVMRSNRDFTYHITQIAEPPEVFTFIQHHAGLTDEEIYATYNMGTDYAIFLPKSEVAVTKRLIKSHGFSCIEAGYIEKGERKVIIEPLNITFSSESMAVKSDVTV